MKPYNKFCINHHLQIMLPLKGNIFVLFIWLRSTHLLSLVRSISLFILKEPLNVGEMLFFNWLRCLVDLKSHATLQIHFTIDIKLELLNWLLLVYQSSPRYSIVKFSEIFRKYHICLENDEKVTV